MPFLSLADGQPGEKYLQERRARSAAPAAAPAQVRRAPAPPLVELRPPAASSGEREISTDDGVRADARARWCATRPSARTSCRSCPTSRARSAWKGMFRQLGIYFLGGQLYKPQDADQLMYYREDKSGQVLQEGINEAGAMSSWIAGGDVVLDQRRADRSRSTSTTRCSGCSAWATSRGSRATCAPRLPARRHAGRTTLNGEGLQHEDGHSHVLASHDPQLHLVRSDVRVRGGGDHRDGIRGCTRRSRTSTTTSR
jgi:pyruvate dehydrogenase E1 component